MSEYFSSDEPRTIGVTINVYIEELLREWFDFFDLNCDPEHDLLPTAVCKALESIETVIGNKYYAPANGIDPFWEAQEDAYDEDLLDLFDLLGPEEVTIERLIGLARRIIGFDSFQKEFCQPVAIIDIDVITDRSEEPEDEPESYAG